MARINRTDLYIYDGVVTDNDYIIGSDGDGTGAKTRSYRMKDVRDFLLAGLSPIEGGTMRYTEYEYNGILTTPSAVVNLITPAFVVLPYHVFILNLNGDKYLLKLQDVTVGNLQTPVADSDFILLRGDVSLGDGLDILKGYNVTNKKHEFYSLKSTSLNLSKETSLSVETGNILVEMKTDFLSNVSVGGETLYKGYNALTSKHEFKGIKDSVSLDVSSNTTDLSIEIKESSQNIGTGLNVYKEFDGTAKKHKFRSISTSNLDIEYSIDGNEITINAPVLESNKSFYVDLNYTGTVEEGSESKPFKTLNKALDAFIGTGYWYNPQNKGYKITLLSYAVLQETNGVGYTGRTNLDINNLHIVGNGYYLNLPANPSANYYPISTRRMVSAMPKTANKLNFEVTQTYENVIIQRIGTDAVVDHLNYAYPTVTHAGAYSDPQNGSYMNLINVTITNDTAYQVNTPADWTTVPNPDDSGNPSTLFGNTIYVSTVQPVGVPMLKTEGMSWNKEGYLSLSGETRLSNFTGTGISITNTTFTNSDKIIFSRNQRLILCQSVISGIYNRKISQHYITCDNVRYFALNTDGPATIPQVANTIGGTKYFIGGSESWIKAINSSSGNILSSYIEGGYNNIFQADGTSIVSIYDSNHASARAYATNGYYEIIAPLPLTAKTVYLSNVVCIDFKVDSTGADKSKIQEVFGEKNSINRYQHNNTGVPTYASNAAAITGGLFKGMQYANTTTGVLSRVY